MRDGSETQKRSAWEDSTAELTDTVASNPAAIDKNLRYLLLRFHGVRARDVNNPSVARLKTLFTQVSQKATARAGWQTVCVALATAPEFSLY